MINEAIWYCNVAVGVNTLGNMMSNLSRKYDLSQRYTNHCLRVTGLQVLDEAQIEGRHIIRVSGHKRTDSVENYARKLSAAKKRKISGILTNYCASNSPNICHNEEIMSSSSHEKNVEIENADSFSDNEMRDIPEAMVESNDITDKEMANIPESMLNNKLNFAPVMNNCSNFSFNIHIHHH